MWHGARDGLSFPWPRKRAASRDPEMTNRITFAIAALLVCGLLADFALDDGAWALFLAKKFMDLLDWAAFWG
mgnify:CR=1 FL=1